MAVFPDDPKSVEPPTVVAQGNLTPNPYSSEYLMIQGALVKLLAEPISWRMRVQVGDAMLTVGRHYESMVNEMNDTAAAYAANALSPR